MTLKVLKMQAWILLLLSLFIAGGVQAQERIISLAPHITEILFAVGAGDDIVGVMAHSDYPDQAKQIPVIGDAHKINYEAAMALSPTLVFGWGSGNGEERVEPFRRLGVRVEVHDPHSLEDVGNSLALFGRLSGHDQQGLEASEAYFSRLETLKDKYSEQKELRVFYQLWDEPMMTFNGNHLINDVIQLCGGTNVFADAIPLVPRISLESVLQQNPEVILIGSGTSDAERQIQSWQEWPSMTAVKNQNFFAINPDWMHRHGPRVLRGAEQVCEALARARSKS